MSELPLVFISEPIHKTGINMLAGNARFIVAPDTDIKTTLKLIKNADAAIVRATTQFDSEVIANAPNLKVIARTGVGMNNVDLEAASRAGIYVCNAPDANTDSVAEHTLTMILCLAKQVFLMNKAVQTQRWSARYSTKQIEVKGKVLGLVGFGEIAKATARLCSAIGMKVIAYRPSGGISFSGVSPVSHFADIFKYADFISIHCPSTPSNYHLVGAAQLKLMKPSAYLINTSRGDLVDELALSDALNNKTIAGAAIDVFETEPISFSCPLRSAPNIVLSPHVAGSTNESDERLAVVAVRSVLDILSGKHPPNIVNAISPG